MIVIVTQGMNAKRFYFNIKNKLLLRPRVHGITCISGMLLYISHDQCKHNKTSKIRIGLWFLSSVLPFINIYVCTKFNFNPLALSKIWPG